MTKINAYAVMYGESTDMYEAQELLEEEINNALREGWVLQGGVSHVVIQSKFHHNSSTHIFSQAIVLPRLATSKPVDDNVSGVVT